MLSLLILLPACTREAPPEPRPPAPPETTETTETSVPTDSTPCPGGRPEVPYDGVDNDCDPLTPDDDLDGDGVLGAEDCDDADPTVGSDDGEVGTWSGNVTTGADVDAVCDGFCRRIVDGSIGLEATDLTSLDGLSCVTEVTGGVVIGGHPIPQCYASDILRGNEQLASIAGLARLEAVGGDLWIIDNGQLRDLDGLGALRVVGGTLEVARCPIDAFVGLDSLVEVGGLRVGSTSPTSLAGLEALVVVHGGIELVRTGLTSLTGLENVTSAGSVVLSDNYGLVSLAGLDNLGSVGSSFEVYYLFAGSFAGLDRLTSIGGDLVVYETPLTSLAGLDALAEVGGTLQVSRNGDLASLDGLENVATVGVDLVIGSSYYSAIDGNDELRSLDALHGLASVGRDVWVQDNAVLGDGPGDALVAEIDAIGGVANVLGNCERVIRLPSGECP